jgi:molybdenum cofactor synthesis domain-containing protein
MAAPEIVTAAMLVIGDEILSGRTKDKNIGFVAEYLAAMGIDLKEARVVSDDEDAIVEAVRALSTKYTYVFTSGGIGPTHDDITADAIAKAFGVSIDEDPRAIAILATRYKPEEFTAARRRMARIPAGADLIENKVSQAPGFRIGNVHVMAGIPSIMQAMMDAIAPTLKGGTRLEQVTLDTRLPEGLIGTELGQIAKAHPGTVIGSYPYFDGGGYGTKLVIRSRDAALLTEAQAAVAAMLDKITAARDATV